MSTVVEYGNSGDAEPAPGSLDLITLLLARIAQAAGEEARVLSTDPVQPDMEAAGPYFDLVRDIVNTIPLVEENLKLKDSDQSGLPPLQPPNDTE